MALLGQGLTVEQLHRIEANRAAALKRKHSSPNAALKSSQSSLDSLSGWRAVRKRPSPIDGESTSEVIDLTEDVGKHENLEHERRVKAVVSMKSPMQQTLSQEQMEVLSAVARRESVFLTGCAGTGKSYVLEFAIRQLRQVIEARMMEKCCVR